MPLQTDPALDYTEHWKVSLQQARWNALQLPGTLAVLLLLNLLFPKGTAHWWGIFLSWQTLAILPLAALLLAWDVGYFLFLGRFRRRCRRAAEAGEALPVPRLRAARLRGILSGLYLPLLILCVILGFFSDPSRINEVIYPGDAYPLVRAEDLGYPASDSGYFLWEGTPFLRHGEALTYTGDHLFRSVYYSCRWEWLAEAVTNDLLREEGNDKAMHFHAPISLSPDPALGFAHCWRYDGGDWQSLLFRVGTTVVSVEGPADFADPDTLSAVLTRIGQAVSP